MDDPDFSPSEETHTAGVRSRTAPWKRIDESISIEVDGKEIWLPTIDAQRLAAGLLEALARVEAADAECGVGGPFVVKGSFDTAGKCIPISRLPFGPGELSRYSLVSTGCDVSRIAAAYAGCSTAIDENCNIRLFRSSQSDQH